ncbi:SagB/ThcOx family dehydrogenase [Microbacterium sp. LMI1-1-1.1]|uniref:SagB/ThcOx family dehydrogenase n=1 Tax=Microbacterium sp. LMI1-1-1.1 TaxID=3135223 RepID=UPI00346692F2
MNPDHATTPAGHPTVSDLIDELAVLFERAAAGGLCHPSWAAAALDLVREGVPLVGDDDVFVAHLIHRSLRAEASKDGPPVSRIATMRAPDLAVRRPGDRRVSLPAEVPDILQPFADLVAERRSTPMYGSDPLPLSHLAGILSQSLGTKGSTLGYQRRDIPKRVGASAGGLQSYDCQVIVNNVEGLEPGRYSYDPVGHELVLEEAGDFRLPLRDAAIESDFLLFAQAVIALTGDFPRVAWKYGTRGYRYMGLDAGIVAAHLYLAATALGVSVNALAAFADDSLNRLLRLDGKDRFAQLLIPIGTAPGRRPR